MSTNQLKPTKATALASVQAMVAGTLKHFPNGSFTFGNVTYTTATLVQELQALEHAIVAVNVAQANAKDAVTALRGIEATVGPLMRNYQRFLRAAFGTATAQLADFGMQPSKARKPLDSAARALATAKQKATRAARGTTSRKQKLAVRGDVTGVVVTPVTAPAHTPSPVTPAPAPAPSSPVTPAAAVVPPAPPASTVAAPGGAQK
jgi:hypothetical protein